GAAVRDRFRAAAASAQCRIELTRQNAGLKAAADCACAGQVLVVHAAPRISKNNQGKQTMNTGFTSRAVHFAVAGLLSLAALAAGAETAQEGAIRKLVEPRLGEGATVDSVTKTPYSGLYEVRTGGDIIYTDEKAQYLF